MTLNLPPPVIFTHKETLHAIELPPLATFLSTLSVPEHLLKLNDILLRYRTPKSYHRVDVREVSSSELPLSSPEPEEAGSRRGKVEDKGEPVILEEGDTVERYRARQGAGPSKAAEEAPAQNGRISPSTQREATAASNGEFSTQKDPRPTDTLLTSTPIDPNVRRSKSPTPPTTVRQPKHTSTTPPHNLPPTGPKRRVRELRLDLRTLDAAALFALETWRRELLGLEKLGMEHPDSIWYKDPTPTPTPTPSPEPVKRKRGPPRGSVGKSQSKTPAVEVDEEEEGSGTGLEVKPVEDLGVEQPVKRKRGRPSTRSVGKSQSRTPAVEVDEGEKSISDAIPEVKVAEDAGTDENVKLAENAGIDENVDSAGLPDGDEMLDGEADPEDAAGVRSVEQEDIQDVEAFDTLVDGPANDKNNEEAVLADKTAVLDDVEQAPIQVDELESSPHPASPDIIIMDGFNRNDTDSDFSPERSPSPVLKRSRSSHNAPQQSFQTLPPPAVMRITAFQAAPAPVAMIINAGPPPASSGSTTPRNAPITSTPESTAFWFQDAPPPLPLGSSSRARDAEDRAGNEQTLPPSRTNQGRPLSLSPTRPPIPIQRQPIQEGGTSDSPLIIPDSPEKRSAFVPFVREQMRIPEFTKAPVVPARGLHWHESNKSRENGRKRKEMENERDGSESRPKVRRRSSIAKVHFAEEEDEDEIVEQVNTHRKQGQKRRAGDSDDDEWADFRF
jgi:hypothetical protein